MTAIAHLHEVERARAARFQELGGHNLAEIARTREFTTEENNQFDTIEREMRQWDARVDTLARQAETEERASSFAANLIDGNRHTPRASSEWRNLDSGERAALDPGESIRSHPVFERATAGNSRAESNYGSLGEMIRALATGGTGSAIVPTAWSANLIDLARSQSAVAMANATIVPMDAKTVTIGRQTGDPSAAFRAEGSVIGASDPTFDSVTLSAKTLSALVVASVEFWQDAPNANQVVERALAAQMGAQVDLVALYGGVTSGAGAINLPSPNPNPRGVLADLSANKPANILGGAAADGTTPTVASGLWNEVLDAYFTVKDGNEDPSALVWSSKLARPYAKAVDTTGQPVAIPSEISDLPRLAVNRIPTYTKGTNTTATDLFVGNFAQLLIGQRMQITLRPLDQLYAGTGQIGVVATWRGDVALARPSAFSVYRALRGA